MKINYTIKTEVPLYDLQVGQIVVLRREPENEMDKLWFYKDNLIIGNKYTIVEISETSGNIRVSPTTREYWHSKDLFTIN